MFRRPGHPVIAYDGPGEGAPGGAGSPGTGGTPPAGGAPAAGETGVVQITPPWAGAAADKPWMVGETGKEQPWFNAVPEAPVRELMSQKAYRTPAELAMAYYNVNKMVGGNDNVVAIPGPNATQEQRDNFYNKLGRPVDPTKYDFNEVWEAEKKATPDFKPNAKLETFARTTAFKYGLTNAQASDLVKDYRKLENELTADSVNTSKAAEDASIEKLRGSFGNEFDAYLEAGKRVYQSIGLDDASTAAIERSMGAAPLLDLLCRIGKASGEANGFKGGGSGGGSPPGGSTPNSMTPEQAAAEITRLRADAAFTKTYTDKRDPGNREAVEKMNQLFARAGDKAVI